MKKILKLLPVFVFLFFLAGCGTQKYELAIAESGAISMEASITRSDVSNTLFSDYGISEDQISEKVEEEFKYYEKKGFKTEYKSDVIKISKDYKNADEFNKEIKQMVKDKRIGLNIQLQKGSNFLVQNKYTLTGRLNYFIPKPFMDKVEKAKKEEGGLKNLEDYSKTIGKENVSLNVYYPKGATVKYMETASESDNYVSFFSTSNGLVEDQEDNVGMTIEFMNVMMIVIIVVVILVIGGVIAFILIRKRQAEEEYDEDDEDYDEGYDYDDEYEGDNEE